MLVPMLCFLAIIGYAVSYKSIYAYHVVLVVAIVLLVSRLASGSKVSIQRPLPIYILLTFYLYCAITSLWHPNINIWMKYMVQLLCGLLLVFSIYSYSTTFDRLATIFRYSACAVLVGLSVGFFESIGAFRYPYSPYSEYAVYFGYPPVDMSELGEWSDSIIGKKPTGFNWNPNNFGFVLAITLPFILLMKSKKTKTALILASIWMFVAIGSRGHFITVICTLMLVPFVNVRSGFNLIKTSALLGILFLLIMLPLFIEVDNHGIERMYSAFQEVGRGIHMIDSGNMSIGGSTATRAGIYGIGIESLLSTYGIGVGIGGMEAILSDRNYKTVSFHFFFLQIIVELGWVGVVFILFYIRCAIYLIISSNTIDSSFGRYLSGSCGISLIAAIPGSIAPSSIHYVLAFYVLVGISIALIGCIKRGVLK